MTLRAATVAVMLMSATAFAEDKVVVTAEVVQISKKGDVVDPPKLAAMKSEFQKQAATKDFTSFKRLSEQKLELVRGKTERVQLVDKRVLNIRLDELKADTATVSVEVPKLVTTKLTLGKKGTVYQHVGTQGDDVLILVLTP
jgi:hypothetical protein